MQKIVLLLVVLITIAACKKDVEIVKPNIPVIPESKNASLTVSFSALVNGKALVPINRYYQVSKQEAYTVTKLNYYISNVRLKRSDGSYFTEPESYHLIKHVDSLTKFTIKDVPPAEYVGIDYLIGVDSLRNVSGIQSGALDPANLMFWDWNTGYIFFKLEGRYGSVTVEDAEYAIHVGGFQAPYSCLQNVSLSFPNTLSVKSNGLHTIDINTAVDEIFKNPKDIGFDYYYSEVVKGPMIFQDISVNYRDIFTVAATN